jgi:hypothetical protein
MVDYYKNAPGTRLGNPLHSAKYMIYYIIKVFISNLLL